ncbi:MAG: S-layer homology domain-containing protein, partial [Tumebacillaceae bacterium]
AAHIISGDGSGHFRPTATMTRDEFATILTKTLGLTPDAAGAAKFTDVELYARPYVGALVNAGITSGISATQFGARDAITRQDMIVFFMRGMKQDQFSKTLNLPSAFSDYPIIATYAQPSVALAENIGLLNGVEDEYGDLYMNPTDKSTREQVAAVANSFYKYANTTYKTHIAQLTNAYGVLGNVATAMKSAGSYQVVTHLSDVSDTDSSDVQLTTDINGKPFALHAVGTVTGTGPDMSALTMGQNATTQINDTLDLTLSGDRFYAGVTSDQNVSKSPKWYMATLPDSAIALLQTGDLQQIASGMLQFAPASDILGQMLPVDQAQLASMFLTKDVQVSPVTDGKITLTGTLGSHESFNLVTETGDTQPLGFTVVVDAQTNRIQSITFTGKVPTETQTVSWTFGHFGETTNIVAPDMSETTPSPLPVDPATTETK